MATTYDNASLVMIPSGIKESKLYSIKPTDGSGDFTFSRGTDTATRVNASGLIEKERSNQLLQSNTFDNAAWTLKRTGSNPLPSVTSGFIDPDGGTNAYRFQVTAPSADNDYSIISQTPSFSGVTGTPFVQSIYVKANGAGQIGKFFDLYAYQPSSSSYRSVENFELTGDWQRVELFHTFNATGSTMEIVFGKARSSAGGSTLANMATDVLIYSSQLEFGLAATSPVIETTTAAVYEGITDNLPRLDYSGGASCPSLLLEPSRTNYLPDGEYIANWAGANTTIVTNATTSPEGLQNAHSVTFASGGYWYKSVSISYTAGQAYTWSIYTTTQDTITRWGGSTPAGTDTLSIEDAGNGWYRQSLTRVVSGSGTANFQPLMDAVFVGVGTTFYVYGAQIEAGHLTSYIPTYGTSASRAGDVCNGAGDSSTFNDSEGVLYAEISALANDSSNRIISVSDGSGSNRLLIKYDNSSNLIEASLTDGGIDQAVLTHTYTIVSDAKIAFKYKANDFALWVNGVEVDTDNSGTTPSGLDTLNFDNGSGGSAFYGNAKQILYFPTALTDAELAALTTI